MTTPHQSAFQSLLLEEKVSPKVTDEVFLYRKQVEPKLFLLCVELFSCVLRLPYRMIIQRRAFGEKTDGIDPR